MQKNSLPFLRAMNVPLPTILFGCLSLASACSKVINPDLPSDTPQLVIVGVVTSGTGPYTVNLTRTVSVDSSTNTIPPVSGATVIISDLTAGVVDTLSETSAGVYTTHILQGAPGHDYGLLVSTGGHTYTATSLMPQPVALDSVTWSGLDEINIVVHFQDPVFGSSHYFQFAETVGGQPLNENHVFVFNDRLSRGKYINQELVNNKFFSFPGAVLQVAMHCIDSAVYTYQNTLTGALGNAATAAPANPISNLSGGALGYFSAETVSIAELTVQ